MGSLIDGIVWVVYYFNAVWSKIGGLWSRLVQWLTDDIPTWLYAQVADFSLFLEQSPLDDLTTFMNGVDYVLPVYAALTIWLSALSVTGAIRVVRWVMAIIPTIGG